jgi:glycosyltransferase involved in cell wall biosynthesis
VSSPKKYPLSVLILTLNEEENLPACLASVANWADVVVLDSGSTDRTVALARAAGARVFTHPFIDFATQRNHAHASIDFHSTWIFHLDADEIMTPALAAECAALEASGPYDGYYVAPQMMFHGHWLRRCTDFPAWQARCVRRQGFHFIQAGHGQREAPALRLGFLQHNYLHDISVHDEPEWTARHCRYAAAEAAQFLTNRVPWPQIFYQLVAGQSLVRRRALKQCSYYLPGRPYWRFLYQYIFRGGLLDGRDAFRYCRLLARYERLTVEALRSARKITRHG